MQPAHAVGSPDWRESWVNELIAPFPPVSLGRASKAVPGVGIVSLRQRPLFFKVKPQFLLADHRKTSELDLSPPTLFLCSVFVLFQKPLRRSCFDF